MTVFNSRGAHLFAGSAPKTSIDVSLESVRVVSESSLADRAHQIQATAWSIVFITGDDVGRTSFKAQAAVNTCEQLLFLRGKLRCELG